MEAEDTRECVDDVAGLLYPSIAPSWSSEEEEEEEAPEAPEEDAEADEKREYRLKKRAFALRVFKPPVPPSDLYLADRLVDLPLPPLEEGVIHYSHTLLPRWAFKEWRGRYVAMPAAWPGAFSLAWNKGTKRAFVYFGDLLPLTSPHVVMPLPVCDVPESPWERDDPSPDFQRELWAKAKAKEQEEEEED
eukprot:gnl/Dysnectes_brevis/8828_a15991_159.p2 GENE.gnl/Dysnectes_brevis/8828_a15991_159~~gnl/Dysnectes_brevis/8828_a15991_159.p2  ORF type:complete len:190 (-),score=83.78 gnl/Dysnectes_brevis/8828_a15991_159:42-611(-)